MVPICDSEPIGSPVPRRTFSTPAMNVVETAPNPTSITPSFPLAGAMSRPASTATITVLSETGARARGPGACRVGGAAASRRARRPHAPRSARAAPPSPRSRAPERRRSKTTTLLVPGPEEYGRDTQQQHALGALRDSHLGREAKPL